MVQHYTFLNIALLAFVMTIFNPFTLQARQFAGGSGTQGDPYQIATAEQLDLMRLLPAGYYLQTADIDLNVVPYNTGEGWEPVSNFTGTYNGGGFTISGLMINRPATSNVGLFGTVTGATLTDLTFSGVTITGSSNVGVLVGFADGATISRTQVTDGTVTGQTNVGGLLGRSSGSLSQSYSTGVHVTGTGGNGQTAGGLVGELSGSVSDSYVANTVQRSRAWVGGMVGRVTSTGTVTTSYSAGKIIGGIGAGGLIGTRENGGLVSNSFYNTDSTSAGADFGGTGLTTAQMQQESFFTSFDFTNTWFKSNESSFPSLQVFADLSAIFAGGSGTQNDPYQITTAIQLNNIRLAPSSHFIQTADIDLDIAPYNTGEGWDPVPNFTGSFDGGGYTISNLYINRGSVANVGLFGLATGVTLKNMILSTPIVTGSENVGSLVGFSFSGTVSDVWVKQPTVIQSGNNQHAGGIIGSIQFGSISRSYITGGSIQASSLAGGIAGKAANTTITDNYSASVVTGSGAAGLVSNNLGSTIVNSYYNSDSTAAGMVMVPGLLQIRCVLAPILPALILPVPG